ncbi:MAG: RNA polymerase sigma factor [bacterium]
MEGIITIPEKTAVNTSIDRTYALVKDKLRRFIQVRVGGVEDAEDIMQDVFYQLAAADPEEQIASASAWLFTVARNKITDWYRKKKAVSFSTITPDIEDDPFLELEDTNSLLPDQLLENSFFREALMNALDELPEAQRDVFVMHEIEGIPYEEISRMTGEKVNTLLSRKRYALKYLQRRLAEFNQVST